MKKFQAHISRILIFITLTGTLSPWVWEHRARADDKELSPAAIGWGNTFVPGLGATLRGQPGRGALEATVEIGTYYGGTFGVREGVPGIDGDVSIPTNGDINHASTGMMLQEFGLKLHMFDTFYHYQQVCIAQEEKPTQLNNPQPLYRGTWTDVLSAPFQWRYLKSPYVWPVILGVSGFLFYTYATSNVTPISLHATPFGETMYGVSQTAVMPWGSEFGEEVFYRGFIEREVRSYTGSLTIAVATESTLFALGHNDKITSGITGIYFGLIVPHLGGDLGYAIAPHFWLDVVDGMLTYWTLRRAQAKNAPLDPSLVPALKISIPF
jgi:hypothetical protein